MIETPDVWQADTAMNPRVPALLTALFTRRTWTELLYAVLGLGLGIAGFTFTAVTVSVSGGMLITFVGLPLLAATGLLSRWFGYGVRHLANTLADAQIRPPEPFRAQPGLFGWLGACLKDGTAWRARLYLVLKLPLGILSFTVATMFYSYGVGGLTYGIWYRWLPCNTDDKGVCHRAAELWPNFFLDTPGRIALLAVIALVLLLIAPWAVRAAVHLDVLAARALLGPSWTSERVAELEQTRATAVEDSAATLRRIERNLHDGTQARLVALAMNVGLAKEKLAEGGDPAEAQRLLDTAHTTAKEAIVELRDLAKGIHPPVLDAGLDTALATLAAHSAVPVRLRTALTDRPAPAIETIAYFCAAELLTNVAKHSGASTATIDARTADGLLRLQVADDGHGGARVGAGSGLSGLSERVRTVDGRMSVDSPTGGPTVVTVELPVTTRGS
jgi:signal transduction histidine kinase